MSVQDGDATTEETMTRDDLAIETEPSARSA